MRLAITALALATGLGATAALRPSVEPPTVAILVRHAEKADAPANDPPLTAEGSARAQALVEVAKYAGVQAVITTQFARTKLTGEPTAKALGVPNEVVAASGGRHAQDVADAIRTKHRGHTVLVVGHSNTIPAIVGALGAPRPADLCDSDYDRVFVVIIPDSGPARLVQSRFGAPSPAAATGCPQMQQR